MGHQPCGRGRPSRIRSGLRCRGIVDRPALHLQRLLHSSLFLLLHVPSFMREVWLPQTRIDRRLRMDDAAGHPDIAVYAQHSYGEMRRWEEIEKLDADLDRPVVYVARGSHASYFTAGFHQTEAWYDLAAVKATLNKPAEAIPALKNALETSSNRLARDPKSRDLRTELKQDPRFSALRTLPEFQKLTQSP